jgi:hypothetical protein
VGFEPTIPAFEQAKTVHALDRVDTVIGNFLGEAEENKAETFLRIEGLHTEIVTFRI